MTDNDKDNDDARDDVDWLRDAFDRAIQGDNGTVPDASRPAVNPFAGLTPTGDTAPIEPVAPAIPPTVVPPTPVADTGHRHDLDLDFETENLPPVTAFEPVVPQDRPLPSVVTDYPPTEAIDAVDLPTTVVPEPVAPVQPAFAAPTTPEPVAPRDETSGIDQLDALFSSTETSAATIPIVGARIPETPSAATGPRETNPLDQAKFRQGLILAIGGLLAVIVAIGAWVAGALVGTPAAAPTPTETAAPALPTATQPPGDYAFGELFGGECLEPFDGPWASTFTVVDCATPHAAQLVYAGDLAVDGTYPSYPGDSRIGKAAMAACSREGVLDLASAKSYADMQLSTAFPASSTAWDSGDTRYFCFASLASAGPIEGSVAGKLLTATVEPTPEATPSD